MYKGAIYENRYNYLRWNHKIVFEASMFSSIMFFNKL